MALISYRFGLRKCTKNTKRFLKSKIRYYNNSDSTFNLEFMSILSGDVHPMPGPIQTTNEQNGAFSAIPTRITNRTPQLYPRGSNGSDNRNLISINTNYHTNQNNQFRGQSHSIKLSHLNVRSLKNREHFHQVADLVSNGDYDVFTVSETWFNSSVRNTEVNIPGYHLARLDRKRKTGTGVCAYVRNSLKLKVLSDITANSEEGFQQLWFTIQHKKLRSLVICVVYRPPDVPLTTLTEALAPAYSQAATLGKDIIILGDLNCDLLAPSKPEFSALNSLCSLLTLKQLISEPTRVTQTSQSLIDVILTSNEDLVKCNKVLYTTISDHFLVSCELNLKRPRSDPPCITTRSYKTFDPEAFSKDISSVPWNTVGILDHVDDQVSMFNSLFLEVLDQHAPKTFKAIHKKSRVISPEIKTLMSQRDSLHKTARQTGQSSDWQAYRSIRQQVKAEIRSSETKIIREEINSNSSKSSIWKTVRRCLNPYGNSNLPYSKDSTEVLNSFNEYFVSVGDTAANQASELAKQHGLTTTTPTISTEPTTSNSRDISQTFKFERVTASTVKEIITAMPSNKAPGYDRINIGVVKTCLPHILHVLTDLFNKSLMSSQFPKEWKIAEVVAHPKEGDHEEPCNNRPISLLPVLSKILERIVHNQFVNFLVTNNKLSIHQSGNKQLHSTETLGLLFTSHLLRAIDEKKVTAVMLLDLSKAFDSINHQTLLIQLKGFDVSPGALSWFESYLTDRQQCVRINNSRSNFLTIQHGVPQGSILGPLLFNLYINDLPSMCNTCSIESYVDDSKLYLSFPGKDVDSSLRVLKEDLLRVASWCCTNGLLINPKKTKFCVFGSEKMLARTTIPSLTFLGEELQAEDHVKDLGIILDKGLTFTQHIDSLVSDLMGKLLMISRISHLFDKASLFTIINSLVFSKMFYCSTVWAGTTKSNISKLQLVLNFAARLLSGKRKYDHISPTLKSLNLLPVSQLLTLRDSIMMFKIMNKQAPNYLLQLFNTRSSIHNYNTRNKDNLNIPKCRTTITQQNSFEHRGTKVWNSIPQEIKNSSKTVYSFKRSLKATILNNFLTS